MVVDDESHIVYRSLITIHLEATRESPPWSRSFWSMTTRSFGAG